MTTLKMAMFDFDGTLCDSAASIIRLTQQACTLSDVPVPSEAQIRRNIGEGLLAAGLDYASQDEEKAQAIFDNYRALARAELSQLDKPVDPLFKGAREALVRLQADNWLIAIVTNKGRHGLSKMCDRHQISDLIDISYTADDVAVKPAPDMALAALAHYGTLPHRAAFIGDTINDALCAKGAGVRFIGVDWGYHDNDVLRAHEAVHIALDFEDLTKTLAKFVPDDEAA